MVCPLANDPFILPPAQHVELANTRSVLDYLFGPRSMRML
jgi:hypothetical protein